MIPLTSSEGYIQFWGLLWAQFLMDFNLIFFPSVGALGGELSDWNILVIHFSCLVFCMTSYFMKWSVPCINLKRRKLHSFILHAFKYSLLFVGGDDLVMMEETEEKGRRVDWLRKNKDQSRADSRVSSTTLLMWHLSNYLTYFSVYSSLKGGQNGAVERDIN